MTNKDKIILQKIVGYIDDVSQYRQGLDADAFLQDKIPYLPVHLMSQFIVILLVR